MGIHARSRPGALNITPPKMAHGEADRMLDFMDGLGINVLPWQRDFLQRLEAASIHQQFLEITRGVR